MKWTTTVGLVAFTAVVSFMGLWSWKHSRHATLTSFNPKIRLTPPAPVRLTEGCPEAKHMLDLVSTPWTPRRTQPTRNTVALSQDEVSIYRAMIETWMSHEKGSLKVAITTFPLNLSFAESGLSICGCLHDIYLEESSAPFRNFHRLAPNVFVGRKMRLVDPKSQASLVRANDPHSRMVKGKGVKDAVAAALNAGLFSMSEIAFDKNRRYGIVSYSFWCGVLCGSGATFVLEKVGAEWKITSRKCGGWVS